MRVLLARHGETDWNAAARIQGASDIPLNARGERQAYELGAKLIDMGGAAPDYIYASPLGRAARTAEIIGGMMGIRPIIAPALRELSFGEWEGCTWEEIGERWPREFAAYTADRENYAPPGVESYADMLSRAGPFVDSLRRAEGTAALCVCHSAVMRGLLAREQGLGVAESYRRLRLPNGALVELGSLD